MKNKKSLLLTSLLLAFVMVFTTAIFAACAKKEHKIEWKYDDQAVTVTVEGQDKLPEKLAEGEQIEFKVTPKTGYKLTLVSGATKKSEGVYTLKMDTADKTVTINSDRIVKDINVEVLKNKVYFLDDQVDKSTLKVTAIYEVGDPAEVEASKYSIVYQAHTNDKGEEVAGGDRFAMGDTKFSVAYDTYTKEVQLTKAVNEIVTFQKVTLFVDTTGEKDLPGLNVTGTIAPEYEFTDVKTAETTIEKYIANCTERNSWSSIDFTAKATVDQAARTFALKLTITGEIQLGQHYFFHVGSGADGRDLGGLNMAPDATAIPGASDSSRTAQYIGEPIMGKDGRTEYYYGPCASWGSLAIMIVVTNADMRSALTLKETLAVNLKVDNMANPTKALYVVTGKFENVTEEKLKIVKFGNIQNNGTVDGLYDQVKDPEKISDDVYRLWFDVTGYDGSMLWANLYYTEDNLQVGSVKLTDHSANGMYCVVGDKVYSILLNNASDKTATDENTYDMPNLLRADKTDETNPETADPEKFDEVVIEPDVDISGLSIAITDVDLAGDKADAPTKAYYILTVKVTGEATTAQLEALAKKVQFGNVDSNNPEKTYLCSVARYEAVANTADTYKLYFDVTTGTPSSAGGEWVWAHLYIDGKTYDGANGDIKPANALLKNGTKITVGNKEFSIKCESGDKGTYSIAVLVTKDLPAE